MSLITVHLGMVKPHGTNDVPAVASGRVEFTPTTHGKYAGAFRTIETVNSSIVQGVMDPVELTPGAWNVTVSPTTGPAWPTYTFLLTEDLQEPVNIVDLAPEIVIDGQSFAKGDQGPPGPGIIGGYPNEDGSITLTLENGEEVGPVQLPRGPQGVQGLKGDKGDTGDVGPAGPTKLSLLQDVDTTSLSVGDTLVYSGSGQWSSDPRLTRAWEVATSPTINMIHNGNGRYGTENFSQTSWRRYPEDAPVGASASFGITIPGAAWLDKHIAVDPSRKYRMMATVRQSNPDYSGSDLFYMALMPIDSDGRSIQPYHYARYPGTLTTLAEPLNAGDTQARIATVTSGWSGVNWNNAYFAIYNYVDSNGKAWGEAYSRNTNRADSITGDVIALRSPYVGETIPAGTPVGVNASGGNYMYPLTTGPVPHEWTPYTSHLVGGIHDASRATAANRSFPEMTASVRAGFLLNYTGQTESRHRVANVGFFDVTDSLPGMDAAYWSGWRDISSTLYSDLSGEIFMERSGREVRVLFRNVTSTISGDRSIFNIPFGFSPPGNPSGWRFGMVGNDSGTAMRNTTIASGNLMILSMPTGESFSGMITWTTDQPVPTSPIGGDPQWL